MFWFCHSEWLFLYLSFSENRFKSIGRVLVYTPGGSGLLTEVLNPIPVSPPPAIGNVNFQVLLTDYSNYAFLDICQNINGIAEEFVVLLVRSLASPEITTFPILGTVFNTFFGLTGYTGGSLRYVYQDSGLCSGI